MKFALEYVEFGLLVVPEVKIHFHDFIISC